MEKLMKYMKRPFRKKGEKGITLLEILAVLVIIALVFIALSRNLGFGSDKAKTTDVQQAFKPFQTAFESGMNEYSGLPSANSINTDYTTLNKYLGVDYQIGTPTATGAVATHPAGNLANTSKLNDPWNKAYMIQAKYISTTDVMLMVRTSGKDKSDTTGSGATKDIYLYTNAGTDADDILFVTHFKNGVVKSCTSGLEKNVGSMTVSAGVVTGCN